jgi:hypothetical protein
MAELRLPIGAEELLRYFESIDREYPGEHWRNGAAMCRRWQVLLVLKQAKVSPLLVVVF